LPIRPSNNMTGGAMMRRTLLVVVLLALLVALSGAVPALASTFPDVPSDHPYRTAIEGLAARSIVGGYSNGLFQPADPVKRMQFAKMIDLTLGLLVTENDVCTFSDVTSFPSADPLYPDNYIAVAAREHLVVGYTDDNTFRPSNPVTRYQVVTIAVRAAGSQLALPPDGWSGLLDYSDPTHGQNLKIAEFNGLLTRLQGLEDNWNGSENASRGECAQVLWNLLEWKEGHGRWTNLAPVLTPTERAGAAMAWLPSNKILLFGGAQSPAPGWVEWSNEVYLYDPVTNLWSKPPDTVRPWSRSGGAMVYSPSVQKVILFGGIGGKGIMNDTYSYDDTANVWTELKPAGPVPSPRYGFGMALGDTPDKIYLFGGFNVDTMTYYRDTWVYDCLANTWTELHPSGTLPSARTGTEMAYDPVTKKVLLFGGNAGGYLTNDTWAYDPAANSWTQLDPTGALPPIRCDFGFARDEASGMFILFGGYGDHAMLNDTFAYDSILNSWEALNPLSPPPARYQCPMVYDATSGRVVLFGGIAADNETRLGDTWAYRL
jgi:N-acetylneuraminic acid mutarotase